MTAPVRALCAGVLCALAPFAAATASAAPNLPANRVLEKVSPDDKSGGDAMLLSQTRYGGIGGAFSSAMPGRVVYDSYASFAGSDTGWLSQYLARRTADGWVSLPITAPLDADFSSAADFLANYGAFLCDTCEDVVGWTQIAADPTDTTGSFDAYVTDGHGWTRVSRGSLPGAGAGSPDFQAPQVSADGRSIGWETSDVIEPEAAGSLPGAINAYVRRDGRTRLVNRATDGTLLGEAGASIGGLASSVGGATRSGGGGPNAISQDGRRVFFVTGERAGGRPMHLYVREDDRVTRQLDAEQCVQATCDDAGVLPVFAGASRSGELAYFGSATRLVDGDGSSDPTAPGLYQYNLTTGRLRFIAPDVVKNQNRLVNALSDDGQTLLLTSTQVLANAPNARGDVPVAGADNLYLAKPEASGGTQYTFIGVRAFVSGSTFSANGRFATLVSPSPLTQQDTAGTTQTYRLDVASGAVICVSCGDGQPLASMPELGAADLPTRPSNDGAIAFTTATPLDPRDDNGRDDVYLWQDGRTYLLTSGHGDADQIVVDVSADGTDVYFATSDRLVPGDHDGNRDLYDARVGGGFPTPDPAPEGCVGDACQPPPGPAPVPFAPASGTARPGEQPALPTRVGAVSVRKQSARREKVTLRVSAPTAGVLTVSGRYVTTRRVAVSRAKSMTLTVTLTSSARRALKRSKKLRVTGAVQFRPNTGRTTTARFAVTTKA